MAVKHNLILMLYTYQIEEAYESISKRLLQFLHPNLSAVTLEPCRAIEFALADGQIGIVIQQW